MNIPADSEVSRKIENLYNRFKVMLIKRDEASKNRVTAILKSIDEELAKKKSRFLTGESLIPWFELLILEFLMKGSEYQKARSLNLSIKQGASWFFCRRHSLLFRHGTDAEAAARSSRWQILPRLRGWGSQMMLRGVPYLNPSSFST